MLIPSLGAHIVQANRQTPAARIEFMDSTLKPLLCARRNGGIARLQFALAGMNAHINRDLPQGIVQVFEALWRRSYLR
jgi:Family of unknown function (DUF5995)